MKNKKPLSRYQMMRQLHMPSQNPLADKIGLSVKEAVEAGMKVRLPNLLDDYYLMKEDGGRDYDILWAISSEVSTKHDITHDEARDIVVGSLTDLGVDLGANS